MNLPTYTATRYITPFRQGGSLPALVEASDGERYVMKFAGAGQGTKALIAEVIAGEIGRALGLNVPPLALLTLERGVAEGESHQEIRDLLKASVGMNLGMRFVDRAVEYAAALREPPTAEVASAIVWFDAFVTNVDRTARNVNMLLAPNGSRARALWLIDHGASLYFHHSSNWRGDPARALTPFAPVKDHVLLHLATLLDDADADARTLLTEELLRGIVAAVPDEWLLVGADAVSADEVRAAYLGWLTRRLSASEVFLAEARAAHSRTGVGGGR